MPAKASPSTADEEFRDYTGEGFSAIEEKTPEPANKRKPKKRATRRELVPISDDDEDIQSVYSSVSQAKKKKSSAIDDALISQMAASVTSMAKVYADKKTDKSTPKTDSEDFALMWARVLAVKRNQLEAEIVPQFMFKVDGLALKAFQVKWEY